MPYAISLERSLSVQHKYSNSDHLQLQFHCRFRFRHHGFSFKKNSTLTCPLLQLPPIIVCHGEAIGWTPDVVQSLLIPYPEPNQNSSCVTTRSLRHQAWYSNSKGRAKSVCCEKFNDMSVLRFSYGEGRGCVGESHPVISPRLGEMTRDGEHYFLLFSGGACLFCSDFVFSSLSICF